MKIDWDGIHDAFIFGSMEGSYLLDKKTGKTVVYHESELEWSDITEADLEDDPERYIEIEPPSSDERYDWMADYAEGVTDEQVGDALARALGGRRPFRRFKDVLEGHAAEREAWFAFEDEKIKGAIEEWVKDSGLAPENPPPWRVG